MKWDDVILEAAETDTGMRRLNNQDSCAVVRSGSAESWKRHGHLFIVADGMGGHAVGELASKMACDNIPHLYKKQAKVPPKEAIVKAYKDVGAQINAKSKANKDFQEMGTTCSTLALFPEEAMIAHVGDSRVYRIRDERIEQLTFDHSLVWELARRSNVPLDDAAKVCTRKNIITRSLGPDPVIEVDVEGPFPIKPGDVFLLCSDGLSGPVQDEEIGAFAGHFHPKDAARYLLHLANLRGGNDNITVVVVRLGVWTDPEKAEDGPTSNGRGPAGNADGVDGKKGGSGSLLGGLLGPFKRKPTVEGPVETEPYIVKPCQIERKMIDRCADLVTRTKEVAVEESWSVDWAALTANRKKAIAAFEVGRPRKALKYLGEAIVLLGIAGRLFRKAQNAAGASGSATR